MSRRIVVLSIVVLVLFSVVAAFGQDKQQQGKIQIIPRVSLAAVSSTGSSGSATIFRAVHAGTQIMYDLGFIHPGVQIGMEYDAWYNVVALPLNVVLGLGKGNFWLIGGWTVPMGTPILVGTTIQYNFGFNVGFGFNIPFLAFKLGPGTLRGIAEVIYTNTTPTTSTGTPVDIFTDILGILTGLKGYVGASYELRV